jgi:hypothetical protein
MIGALIWIAIAILAIMIARTLERRERAKNPALYLPAPGAREYPDPQPADAPRS